MISKRVALSVVLAGVAISLGVIYFFQSDLEEPSAKPILNSENIELKFAGRQPDILFTDLMGGAIKEADTKYRLRAKTSSPVTGTCYFILKQGDKSITLTTTINNSSVCQVTRPLSIFTDYGEWNMGLIFDESSGKFGLGNSSPIIVSDLIKTESIEINTLSATRDGNVIKAQVVLPRPLSGVCSVGFTKGTHVVSRTGKAKESALCEVDIPISDFPYSHIWKMDVIFFGDDELAPLSGNASRNVYIDIK